MRASKQLACLGGYISAGTEELEMCRIADSDIHVVVTGFPSGTRDFCLLCQSEDGTFVPVEPLSLLGLDRAAAVIRRLAQSGREDLAMNVALCRLLVPQLSYRGSGRHLVVENWTEVDLCGDSLGGRPENLFARDLSSAQARDWRLVTNGERPDEGSLAELAWRSFTVLPELEERFEDPQLGEFTRALHQTLVPPGDDYLELQTAQVSTQVSQLRQSNFDELDLPHSPRRLNRLFRKFLAVTLRWSGQLTGVVVEELIRERTVAAGNPDLLRRLTPNEERLLALRYGAPRILSDINIGYLFGCGDIFADLINDYGRAHVVSDYPEHLEETGENLGDFFYLVSRFLERRRAIRAHQRRELRQRRAQRLPGGAERRQAQNQPDESERTPPEEAIVRESLEMFGEVFPALHERDQARLQAYINANGNRRTAADSLGLSLTAYSRQLRQTVFPNVRRAARELGLFEQLEGDED